MSDLLGFAPDYTQVTGITRAPFGALGQVVPEPLYSPFNTASGPNTAPPLDLRYQEHLTSLDNKYRELAPQILALPPEIRDSLIGFDAQRVAQGAPPLTRQQTLLAAQTATTNQPATKAPERNPLDLIKNFRGDLSTLLKSIPRLPLAAFHEVQEIPHFGERVQEAKDAGASPLAALLQAPGVRLIPGTYTAANLLSGTEGLREAITHPLFTGLDLLPAANSAAASTKTGRLLVDAAEAAGKRPRPLTGLLTNTVDDAGNLTRNRLGGLVDTARAETRVGQTLDAAFGKTSREIMRMRGGLENRYRGLLHGAVSPESPLEAFLPRIAKTFDRYADVHPELTAITPEGEAWRAQAAQDFARGQVDAYDPGFVADYRGLVDDVGKEAINLDVLGQWGGELYPTKLVKKLEGRQSVVNTTRRLMELRNEYLAPSGTVTPERLGAMVDDALGEATPAGKTRSARAVAQVFDAHGLDVTGIRSAMAKIHRSRGGAGWSEVRQAFADATAAAGDSTAALTPRRSVTEIIDTLKRTTNDRQVTMLETAVRDGKRNRATNALKNLYERKPPKFPEAEWPAFREDIRSAARRMEFDAKVGSKATEKRLAQQEGSLANTVQSNPPARFDEILAGNMKQRLGAEAVAAQEKTLGRRLNGDEAAQITTAIQERRWKAAFPDMPAEELTKYLRGIEGEIKQTWQALQDEGFDPIFVHKVSPARATATQTGNIGPVPVTASQGKERALDLSPSVNDLQVSLSHQAGELLQDVYRDRFAEDVIKSVGKPEAALREELAPFARTRAATDPTLNFEGHLQEIIRKRYERFNPETAGFSWGGVKLDKYVQEQYYIPKAVADNLHRLVKPPNLLAQATAPITNAFRYNVIGLSPSVVINNFFSNAVATLAETGPGPFKYWGKAKEWLKDPSLIPDENLKAMMLAENPAMPTLNRDSWLKSGNGQRFEIGSRAYKVFSESAAANAVKAGKRGLDGIVEKSLNLQRLGDNIYRGMIYMNEHDNALAGGATAEKAASRAIEQVQRVLVDYNSFTPIERQAIRTIIPFYSYMGHAMRFVGRYPLDHPMRASITAKLADAERERLGALPESFLSMLPIGGKGKDGKQRMIPLRPFDPFGDISDMFSIAGWLSATNPLITTALESVGVKQGEAEGYPTLRYNAETGRMEPVHGGLFTNLLENTAPRLGLATAALGLNPVQNEMRRRDPAAANRMLLTGAGIPAFLRQVDVPREGIRAELARQQSQNDVRNQALRSGNWREALRYPGLHAYFDQVLAMNSGQVADLTPNTPEAIQQQIEQLLGAA